MRRHMMIAGVVTAIGLLCTACIPGPSFAKATGYTPRMHSKDEILLLMNGTVPTDPYYHVGQIQVSRSNFESNDDLFNAMRDLGVQYGFDGISEIVCGPDYYSAFMCTGQAFVFK